MFSDNDENSNLIGQARSRFGGGVSVSKMTVIETEYVNTDLDLTSEAPFDTLHAELSKHCSVLHYTQDDDGHWHSTLESNNCEPSTTNGAARDIQSMIAAIAGLTSKARAEFDACYLREFNIGFHCGDTWAYVYQLPTPVIAAVANISCTIAVTLYPMRHRDGTPRI